MRTFYNAKTLFTTGLLVVILAPLAPGGPGQGINVHPLVLKPYVDIAGTYDDNLWLADPEGALEYYEQENLRTEEEQRVDDYYLRGTLGLSVRNRAEALRFAFDAWGTINRYYEVTERDNEEYGERLNLGFGSRDDLDVNLYQRYSLADEYDHGPRGRETMESGEAVQPLTDPMLLDRNELTRRAMFDAGIKLGRRMSDKTDLDVSYVYNQTTFDYDRLYDRTEHRLNAEAGWRATDKSSVFILVEGGVQDSEGYDSDANILTARIGAATRRSEKLIFRGSVGASYYEYDGAAEPIYLEQEPEDVRTESKDITRLDFQLGGNWKPADKWVLQMNATSGYTPSAFYAHNVAYQNVLASGLSYEVNRRWRVTAIGSIRRDDFLEEIVRETDGEVIDKYIVLWSAGCQLSYDPESFYSLFAEYRYTEADSNDPLSEYDVNQVVVGITAWY